MLLLCWNLILQLCFLKLLIFTSSIKILFKFSIRMKRLYLYGSHLQRNFFYLKEIIELYFKDHKEIRLNMKLMMI